MEKSESNGVSSPAEAPPEYLSALAHELRNPLAPIRTGSELLRSICTDPRQLQIVDMISRQVVRLTHMLDDLLEAARLRRGLVTLRKQRVDAAIIVEQALEAVRPGIDARRQSLLVSLPSQTVRMYCDPVRLVQVLQNLLDNANRFTPEGGAISLNVEVVEEELVFEVADNGAGIDPELLPRLFNVFAQGPQQVHRPYGGLGLGLAIARNLVELHGGTISAHSAGLAQGSRFIFRLPIEQPALAPAANNGAAARVLIIDDNAIVATNLSHCLQERGFRVMTASSGEAGVTLATQFRPQAVLVSIGLRGMDGFETARQLRYTEATTNAVLIAISGYSLSTLPNADPSVFSYYLSKPATSGAIAVLLEKALGPGNPIGRAAEE